MNLHNSTIGRRLIRFLVHRLLSESRTLRRPPDFIVGSADDPYLHRWWVIPRNPLMNVYLHEFLRSDDDRALHDHPWVSLSICLYGEMLEFTATQPRPRRIRAGDVVLRGARFAHRLQLNQHYSYCFPGIVFEAGACTLFITGPRIRAWGFHCPKGWVPWQVFTAPHDKGQIGRGCE